VQRDDLNYRTTTAYLFLGFLIWPFGAFLYALKYFRENRSKVIFILFAMLYGYTFMHRADSERVASEFLSVANLRGNEVVEYFEQKTSITIDVFLPLVNILVSRLSSSANFLYVVYAFIYFSFVIASTFLLIYLNGENKLSWESGLLLLLFLFYIRYSAINGVRYWIACFIFIYSLIQVIYYDKSRLLLLALITPAIHFSFLFILPIIVVYYLLKKHLILCYILLIISLMMQTFISSGFIESLGIFNETRSARMEIYLYEGNVERRLAAREGVRWVIKYGAIIARWALGISIFLPHLIFRHKITGRDKNMFAFLIIFLSFLQFTSSSYELHRRFFEVFIVASIAYLYKLSLNHDFKYKLLAVTLSLSLLPQILFGLRASFETTNIGLFISSVFTIQAFVNDPTSIVDIFF